MTRGRPEGGIARSSRTGRHPGGNPAPETIAALPDEVKARAADLGLDDNQSALLQAAKAPTPQAQVATLERRAERAPERPAEANREAAARPIGIGGWRACEVDQDHIAQRIGPT